MIFYVIDITFGCHIAKLCQREQTVVPKVVTGCTEAIEEKGNIYRDFLLLILSTKCWVTLSCCLISVHELITVTNEDQGYMTRFTGRGRGLPGQDGTGGLPGFTFIINYNESVKFENWDAYIKILFLTEYEICM